jgi:hypothetical protein
VRAIGHYALPLPFQLPSEVQYCCALHYDDWLRLDALTQLSMSDSVIKQYHALFTRSQMYFRRLRDKIAMPPNASSVVCASRLEQRAIALQPRSSSPFETRDPGDAVQQRTWHGF